MTDDAKAIVIDVGTATTRMGFAGDKDPTVVFPSIVAEPRGFPRMAGGSNSRSFYVGDQLSSDALGLYNISRPIRNHYVVNWDHWERIIAHSVSQIEIEEYPLSFTVPLFCPLAQLEKTAQYLFETFCVRAAAPVLDCVAQIYASGGLSGLYVDIGEGGTQVAPVMEQAVIEEGLRRSSVGGQVVTEHLGRLLAQSSHTTPIGPMASSYQFEMNDGASHRTERPSPWSARLLKMDEIKRKVCFVALRIADDMEEMRQSTNLHTTAVLPDGREGTLGYERIWATEALFNPSIVAMEEKGLADLIFDAWLSCPIDTRKELAGTIVLGGGVSLTPGIVERLEMDLNDKLPIASVGIKRARIRAMPNREHLAWRGAAAVTHLPQFLDRWFSLEQYNEEGCNGIFNRGLMLPNRARPSLLYY